MKSAKLFQNGQSQAVRLPKEFRFPGKMVFIKRQGNTIVLIPIKNPWQSLFNSLDEFSEDFMNTRKDLTLQERDSFE
jgi:antitoxin VapB